MNKKIAAKKLNNKIEDVLTKENIIISSLQYCLNSCSYGNHQIAYKCKNEICPLYLINKTYLSKPHKLTEEQKERLRQQLLINKQNKTK